MRVLFAPYGSLGDLHPMLAVALEMRARGHEIRFCAQEVYREKFDSLEIELMPLRPEIDPDDRALARELMDAKTGTERIVKDLMMANLMPMYKDLLKAAEGVDLLISGEIVYAAKSVVEKLGIKWITTSLSPISMFSAEDPSVFPVAPWLGKLRFLGTGFHRGLHGLAKLVARDWFIPYREFRSNLGLDPDHDPIFEEKFSDLLHLAMYSKVLAKPQSDWHRPTLQTGFCFYDGSEDVGEMSLELEEFLDSGDAPVVFTLGSAAVMDAGDFFEQSIEAARITGRRGVILYGVFNEPPAGLPDSVIAVDYAPFSTLFPRAACVVHQGGVGTTAQVLRAGVPHLIVPFSHDQPDNAARCVRLGVARTVSRREYDAELGARELTQLLGDLTYRAAAKEAALIVRAEDGTRTACDAIESVTSRANDRRMEASKMF